MSEYVGDTESGDERLQPMWKKGYRSGRESLLPLVKELKE